MSVTYQSEELDTLAMAERYQEWIAEQFQPYLSGNIMELGAGIGTMAQRWEPYAEQLYLIEPAENLYPLLEARFERNPKAHLYRGVLENILGRGDAPQRSSVNVVILINVLEHIEHDGEALSRLHDLLVPEGYLLIFVPAMPSLYGSLDKKFGHFRRYTKSALTALGRQAGYQTIRLDYFDMLGVLPWWFVNCVLKSEQVSSGMTRLYDRCVVPIGRCIERHMTFPFGKNLIYVARKPA